MAITNGYATLNELKAFVSIAQADTDHDADLERNVEAASRMIDEYTGRIFYDTGSATAKTFRAHSPYRLDVPDFSTTSGLTVKTDTTNDGSYDTTWTITTDFIVETESETRSGSPYVRVLTTDTYLFPTIGRRRRVEVTARWGWTAVPVEVEQTCLIVAAELWRRKDAPFGVAGFGPDGAVRVSGTEIPMLARLDSFKSKLVA